MSGSTDYPSNPKRHGAMGVHSIDSFKMSVPNVSEADRFYSAFGLETRLEHDGLGVYAKGDPRRWIHITQADKKALLSIRFAAYADDLQSLSEQVESCGVTLETKPSENTPSFSFRENNGLLIEVVVSDKRTLNGKADIGALDGSPAADERGSWSRTTMPRIEPSRLSHILVFTPDVPQSIDFYAKALGLRLSDHSGDMIAFMHGAHGSDHHLVAFAFSGGTPAGLHHCSWDVGSINAVGLGTEQMVDAGYKRHWGLGRHVVGSNYFSYIQDPWGSWCEYSADIDYISHDYDWMAKDHPPEDGIYVWGPELPEDFIYNYEADQDGWAAKSQSYS